VGFFFGTLPYTPPRTPQKTLYFLSKPMFSSLLWRGLVYVASVFVPVGIASAIVRIVGASLFLPESKGLFRSATLPATGAHKLCLKRRITLWTRTASKP
jgi:hypothetical protein